MVLLSALLSAPEWKKHPQAIKPAQTNTQPLRGPKARNAQMAPRTAMLSERANNCGMRRILRLLIARELGSLGNAGRLPPRRLFIVTAGRHHLGRPVVKHSKRWMYKAYV